MSIYNLMRRAARESQEEVVLLRGQDEAPLPSSPASIASTLADHIPSEALAVYASALAFLVPEDQALQAQDYESRWVLAGAVTVLAVLYALGTYRREVRGSHVPFRVPWSKLLLVVVAFGAWVCVIPGSPFNSLSWYTPAYGAVIGIVVNSLIGAVAVLLDEP